MGDLEDRILKKNIPGKYSWWEKDADEGPGGRTDWIDPDASDDEAEMTEMDKQRKFVEADVPDPVRRSIMAGEVERQRATSSKTGVKGVLNDYHDWSEMMQAQDSMEADHRAALLKLMVEGAKREPDVFKPKTQADIEAEGQGSGEDGEDGEDDADFLRDFRAARLEQMKASAGRPRFGDIREVTRSEFVAAVDECDPRTFVVVHLYEPYIKLCQKMNRYLEQLAKEHTSVKFLRLQSTKADGDYDPIALPTLLLYRDKQVVEVLTRVTDDIGGDMFTKDDVDWLLQEKEVFEAVGGVRTGAVGGGLARYEQNRAEDSGDDAGDDVEEYEGYS